MDKLYTREIVTTIVKYLNVKHAIIIYGARQVGKTSVLLYLQEHYLKENCFYFDLEISRYLELCNQGAEVLYAYLLQKGANEKKKIYVIIDEIQYMENPAQFIKVLHDHYQHVKLLASGSSTLEIKKKFKQSLVGRYLSFELHALSFAEFLIFREKEYRLKKENTAAINEELIALAEEYIRFGGYPEIVLEQDIDKKEVFLSQIINTYIRKDIRDIGNIRDIASFNKLLEIVASQSGQLLNIMELANTLQINKKTVSEYLDLLENTFIIKRIRPFHKNLRSELTKNPKVFLLDTGMLHLLWLKQFPKEILGNVFETFVFLELMKQSKHIYFWRTINRQEIDFIIVNKELYAIEAKYQFKEEDTNNLRFFREKYSCKTAIVGLKGIKKGKYVWEIVEELKASAS
ncbi:ATP-binding protein [Candidatus Woesearchaeota archaeon]|nr:ATP-binding protein [Candidatus Woesearchaeota archaeon]